ncbi:MAG: methyltransferase [Hyphomicrobiales bacterium]|nr:methyltransferase [Hyphomicrobiales bacterium]
MSETGTPDGFLGSRVHLYQPRGGHRAGLDAAFLQAAIPAEASGHLIDFGAGCGAVALAAAARAPGLTVTGIERETEMVALAKRALADPHNGEFAGRVRFVEGDVTAGRTAREALGLAEQSADWLVMNPPFATAGQARAAPDRLKAAAHVMDAGGLDAWIRSAAGLLKAKGRLALIHRPDALAELVTALAGRFGAVQVLPLHPRAGEAASRLVVTAIGGSKAPLCLLAGMVLHEEDGSWTAAAADILTGRKALPLW